MNKIIRYVVFLALAALFQLVLGMPQLARAQDAPKFLEYGLELGLIRNSYLFSSDQVSDNCWTNMSSIEAKIRLLLERNEIPVFREPFAFYNSFNVQVKLVAFGFRTGDGLCVVSSALSVSTGLSEDINYSGQGPGIIADYSVAIFQRSAIFTSGFNVNEQLDGWFEGVVSEFIADIISARRSDEIQEYFERFPTFGRDPLTQSQFDDIVKNN